MCKDKSTVGYYYNGFQVVPGVKESALCILFQIHDNLGTNKGLNKNYLKEKSLLGSLMQKDEGWCLDGAGVFSVPANDDDIIFPYINNDDLSVSSAKSRQPYKNDEDTVNSTPK